MEKIIEIIEDHDGWLAVGKPTGLSIHNAEDGINLLSILQEQLGYHLHAAHRLDEATSGVMLLGKNPQSTAMLQQALSTAKKEYTAILRGVLKQESGDWHWPITNKGEGFKNPQGRKSDRIPAQTFYQQIQASQYLTMVKVQLGTGRQHQIRKHAALAKHAVIGDIRYGDRRYNEMIAKRYGLDELCLCASKLEVCLNGVDYCLEVPVPENWSNLFL